MSPLPRLTVNLDGPTGRSGRVFIDGHDITDGVEALTIRLRSDDLTRAELVIGVGELEIDAPTLAILQANVKVINPPEPELRTFGEEPAHA